VKATEAVGDDGQSDQHCSKRPSTQEKQNSQMGFVEAGAQSLSQRRGRRARGGQGSRQWCVGGL
jgi:hypothetical protein